MKLTQFYFALLGVCLLSFLRGQTYLPFECLSLEEGLSHSLVNVLLQDQKGFLWIGTQDGLNRYDGYRFEVFRPDKTKQGSIHGRWVTQLYEDREGQIWIRFRTGGLNRFDPISRRFYLYLYDPEDPHSISGDFPSDFRFSQDFQNMMETSDGTLWIGTTQGLNRYLREEDRFIHYRHDPQDEKSLTGNFITALCEGPDGFLWVGTSKGLNRFDPATGRMERVPLGETPEEEGNLMPYIFHLLPDRQGNIWVGTRWNGLYRLKYISGKERPETRQYLCNTSLPSHERKDGINSILESRRGEIWIGGEAGLFFLPPGAEVFSQVGGTGRLSGLEHLMEDGKGYIWASVNNRDIGVVRINPDRTGFDLFAQNETIPNSLSANAVNTILEDRTGVLWLGTVKGGLNKTDLNRKPFNYFFHHPSNPNSLNTNDVYAIYEDDRSQLWVGSIKGLNRIDRRTGRVTIYEKDPARPARSPSANIVGVIEPDPEGFLWLGYFDYKISKFYPDTEEFVHFHHHELVPDSYQAWSLRDIISNGPGDTWFGACTYGLTQLQPDGQTFRYFSNQRPAFRGENTAEQLTDQKINCLYRDTDGIIWIGAQESGLSRFDPGSQTFTNFLHDPRDPFSISDNEVKCIYEDKEGTFWIGTGMGGLNRFDRKAGKFSNYTQADGLSNNTVQGILPDDAGFLWLSTNQGLSRFDPATGQFKNYYAGDGIQSNEFNEGAYFRSTSGELFFGGVNGLTSFFPDSIVDNPIIPAMAVTEFRIYNQVIQPGDTINGRVVLSESIEYTSEIVLTHEESVFSFEFAALHFADPAQNRFAYKMEGLDPDWNYTDMDKRYVTYTNLNPGDYTFRAKASNNDGLWNEEGIALRITVLPPWWNTVLFRRSAFFFLILLTLLVIRLRTARLKAQKVRLEKLVKKRTQALTQANAELAESRAAILRQKEQIEGQKKHLEEMDEIKTRFYTNISHEFRTPLTLILGAISDLFNRSSLTAAQQSSLRMLERNARRLLRLVTQILDLSKLEGGVLNLEVAHGNMIEHIQLMVDSFQSLARQKDIYLVTVINRQKAPGYFDQDKIEKIVYNLLYNAIKFTPPGGQVSLQLKVVGAADHPETVEISITDTGPGIPESDREAIFKRFYQGPSHDAQQAGTGIGLSLVQHMVALHRGELELKSRTGEEDHGSTFIVRLPLARSAYADQEIVAPGARINDTLYVSSDWSEKSDTLQAEMETIVLETQPKLLLVEDHSDMRAFIRRSLGDLFQVIDAGDGNEGLTLAREYLPDIILTDVMMPKLNGFEFCRRLKGEALTSHIPVIILTAKSSADAELEGLSMGADDYITKPFRPAALQMKLRNIIEGRRQLAERYKRDIWMDVDKVTHSAADEQLLRRAIRIIEEHLSDPKLDVTRFTREMGIGRTVLYEKVKAITGLSVNDLIKSHRLKVGARLLIEEELSISEVSYRVGFNDPKYFSKCFKKHFDKSPREFISEYSK